MLNGSHSMIWAVLLALALLLAVGAGGRVMTADREQAAVARTDCDQAKQKRDGRKRSDWGWNVFNTGSGSPIYRL